VAIWTEPWNIPLVGDDFVTATARSGLATSDELMWDGMFASSFMTAAVLAHNHEDAHCAFSFWVIDVSEQPLKERRLGDGLFVFPNLLNWMGPKVLEG
jgi:hypothetical protein